MANISAIPLPEATTERTPTVYDQRTRTPDEFGAGLARGTVELASGLDRIQAQADALAAQEAETDYAKEILQKVHGTVDPQTGEATPGFSTLKGHAALDKSTSLTDDLTQSRQRIASTLANDRQRRLFLGRTEADLIGAQRAIETHVGEQVNYLQQQGLKTRLEVATQSATSAAVTPGNEVDLIGAARQVDAMKPWLAVEAERQGLRGEDASRFVRAGQGTVAIAVMERLLEDPPKGGRGHAAEAQAFLNANRDIIEEKDAYKFKERLHAADLRDRGFAQADQIWADSNGDPAKAESFVRALPDPAIREEVQRRLNERLQQDHAVRVAADAPREGRLEQSIYQGKGLDRGSQDYLAMSDEGRARVDAKAFAAERADRSEQRQTDQELYWAFKGMPLGGKPGEDRVSTDIDHSPVFANASPAMRNRIKAEQLVARSEWAKDQGVDRKKFNDGAASVADSMGWITGGPGTMRQQFLREMESRYDGWLTANPGAKTVPPQEVAKMTAEAVQYGTAPGRFFGTNNRYQWQSAQKGEAFTVNPETAQTKKGAAAAQRVFGVQPTIRTAPPTAPVQITSDADYEALPSGAVFVGPDGKTRRKP